jgi:hypothetical protein
MKFQAKKPQAVPKAIAQGFKRKEARALGASSPFASSPIVGSPIVVKPASGKLAQSLKPGVAPLFAGGRMTAAGAIQSSRRMDQALAKRVGPMARQRVDAVQLKGASNAAKAGTVRALTINPPEPTIDRATGRKLDTRAFSRTSFRAPFQKSYNLRRSVGA